MRTRSPWLTPILLFLASFLLISYSLTSCVTTSPQHEANRQQAYNATERLFIYELGEVAAGRLTAADAAADLRKALDDLKAAESAGAPQDGTGGLSLGGVLGIALGSTGVGGVALNFLRNLSRKNELSDVPTYDEMDQHVKKMEARLAALMQSRGAIQPQVVSSRPAQPFDPSNPPG